MARLPFTFLMIIYIVVFAVCSDALRGDVSRRLLRGPHWNADISVTPLNLSVRHLLQSRGGGLGNTRATNTLRSESATADAIARAVESGSQLFATRRAGTVGGTLTYAATNSNGDLFDQVEYSSRGGP
jgi:hypothetical protein